MKNPRAGRRLALLCQTKKHALDRNHVPQNAAKLFFVAVSLSLWKTDVVRTPVPMLQAVFLAHTDSLLPSGPVHSVAWNSDPSSNTDRATVEHRPNFAKAYHTSVQTI